MAGPHHRTAAARGTIAALRQETAPGPVSLWEMLVQRKLIGDDQILDAIAARFRFPVADLSRVDPKLSQTVPEQVARRFNVVPVGQTDSYLEVATANPFDIDAEKMLAFATGREVRMLLGSPATIREQLDELYAARTTSSTGCSRASAATSTSRSSRRTRTRRGERRGGQPAAHHPAGGHDARRRRLQPGERHPRRADRGRRRGALPHRRRAAPGHEDPAQRRAAAHLPHQDHVRARHRRPAPAAGRPGAGLGQRRGGRPARLDPAGLAGREGRHPDPEPARHRAEPRRARACTEDEQEAVKTLLRQQGGHHPGDRADRARARPPRSTPPSG